MQNKRRRWSGQLIIYFTNQRLRKTGISFFVQFRQRNKLENIVIEKLKSFILVRKRWDSGVKLLVLLKISISNFKKDRQ